MGSIGANKGAVQSNKVDSLYNRLRENPEALEEYGNGNEQILRTTLQNMTEDALARVEEEYGTESTGTKRNSSNISVTRDSIINNGGSLSIGEYTIEIGRTYNKKTDDYSGPFGKTTIVTGPGVSSSNFEERGTGSRVFRNTESAIDYVKKLNSRRRRR